MRTRAKEGATRRRYTTSRDPVWRDQRNRAIGQMLKRCGDTQAAISLAFKRAEIGNSEAWVSELVNGHKNVGAHVERVEALTRFSATDGAPLAVSGLVAMLRVLSEEHDDDELEVAIRAALQRETDEEGVENAVQIRRCLGDPTETDEIDAQLLEAFLRSIATELTAAGLLWERLRRRAH